MKINFVCKECGSERVTLDATAIWDVRKQEWVLADVCDTAYCNDCGGECNLKEVEVKPPKKRKPKAGESRWLDGQAEGNSLPGEPVPEDYFCGGMGQ